MSYKQPTVLIVDDEQVVTDLLHDELSERGYLCTKALDANEALTKMLDYNYDIALLDIRLPGLSGMEVLTKIQSSYPNTVAIMITAVNDVYTAVKAMKLGASDYIVKPFDVNEISTSIGIALESKKDSPKRGSLETALCVNSEEGDGQAIEESFDQIDAISHGVEAKFDLLDGRMEIVTQRTIDVARQLEISEAHIQRWVATKTKYNTEKKGQIDSALHKLEQSPFAQRILGVTEEHPDTRQSFNHQN